MKKFVLIAALSLLGSAFASSVNVPVEATVSNICVFGNGDEVNANNSTAAQVSFGYDAVNGGGSNGNTAYTVQCTNGATFNTDSNEGATINLSDGFETLSATVDETFTPSIGGGTGGGDSYLMTVDVSAAAGQWSVNEGTYTGTITYTVSYN
ncbi:hypothetical protein [Deinococcus cellulosilyticus]|uniref:Spore coat protein U domain-containing protein n=1 Tax=Deinococcus cellulosilyticus (strain DSM 18568 / NBRC 106333 / KACC 11606 / 5516J-15) TaxID=1223518 RepID=A0A511N7S8_DEIC1|nr:hypothetical protein [Deinococcus cellulosilyticus]GEM48538.1 hypothetical protein DC3_41730 [Deinococcus cellulosilyticus NBRC 106333 = KACC 11606]